MARLYVMRGLPGSGKSTRAREIVQTSPRTIRVNRDDLRLMFFNDRLELRHESLITAVEHGVVLAARDKGYDVIVDDTNLRKDVWTPFARKNGMEVVIDIDLNTASLEELEKIPMIGSRVCALAVINARPLKRWEHVAHIDGFNKDLADELRKGGARLGLTLVRRAAQVQGFINPLTYLGEGREQPCFREADPSI